MTISRYDYEDLRNKAIQPNAKQEDIDALGEWFEEFGYDFWNGEHFDADDGKRLFPIHDEHYDENGELIQADIIGYEFR